MIKTSSDALLAPLCYAAMMCLAVGTNLPPVLWTSFSETLGGAGGLSEEQLGRFPAVTFTALVAAILVTGPLADRWGVKRFTVFGLGLICLGLGLLGGAPDYMTALVAVSMLGWGVGNLEVTLSPIVAALHPRRRAAALNNLHVFYCAGAVAAVLAGSGGLYLRIPWRVICLAVAAFPAAALLGFAWITLPPLTHEPGQRHQLSALLRRPFFLAALAAIGLAGATEVGMAQWLPTYAERGLGYSRTTGGIALGAFSVAMGLGRLLAARAVHRTRPIVLMGGCAAAAALLYVAACYVPVRPVALGACIVIGLLAGCLWPTMLAVTADRFPRGGPSMFGLLGAAGNVGCMIMPWVIGAVAERTTLRFGLASNTLSPIVLVGILAWMGLEQARHRNERDAGA